VLDISYYTVAMHRDHLIDQDKIQRIRKVSYGQGLLHVTCPEGAEGELGADRPATQARVVRWG
jgi:hypothetical protein